jgi:DNA-directed RNA polymerase specialized sigma24 family protein
VAVKNDSDGLTPEELAALLRSLDPDPEKAGVRYEEIRRRLIRFFEWRGCERPEELTDVTFNRVARQLARDLSLRSDPYAYFCGVARLVRLEFLRQEAKEKNAIDQLPPPSSNPGETEDDPDPRLGHLRHCLAALPMEQRELVLRYHQGKQRIQDRKALCQELGIEMNALRIRVHRIRRKIENCVRERLRRGAPSRPR